jgi:hypothetical protein
MNIELSDEECAEIECVALRELYPSTPGDRTRDPYAERFAMIRAGFRAAIERLQSV